ncbi:hypothetical protein J7M28_00175, partial [bacterium]|nr:hypothetical protein [bacterium]
MKKMRIGITIWEDRISPLMDTSQRLLVVEVEDLQEVARAEMDLPEPYLPLRIQRLGDSRLDVLICGAVSGYLEGMLMGLGIPIFAWTSGNVDDVLKSFLTGALRPMEPGRRRGRGRGGCG